MNNKNFNILDKIKVNTSVEDIYRDYNNTDTEIACKPLHELFFDSVQKYPNNIAVVEGKNEITYRELDKCSNQMAKYIMKKVGQGELIGVLGTRKLGTIINILAILKTGGTYVPIDPDYPEERKEYIREKSNCKLILEDTDYDKIKEQFCDDSIKMSVDVHSLAYIIFTSGSTGKPKGVEITHFSACNTILDINERYNVCQTDKIIGLSSLCFDLSVYDIFGTLAAGAKLVQIEDQRDIGNILEIMQTKQITIWNSIPSTMQMLVTNVDNCKVSSLRVALLSGDWIPLGLFDKMKLHFENCQVISLGGATEGAIWSIYYPIKGIEKSWTSIPYGYPLANQKIYILNYENKLCPAGVEGEICIGGVGVAKGYNNDKEKTDKVFIEHETLGRIYKTGDFGIFHTEGYVEFIGRKDDQVKVRGYRIELGEVEAAMNKYPALIDAVASIRKDKYNNNYICGYYITKEDINREELLEHLNKHLPMYMVPTKLMKIESIPLSFNGKVDRKKLPEPVIAEEEMNFVLPENEIQQVIVSVIEECFDNSRKISIYDNFYELGINSMLMVNVIAKIEKNFNIKIKFKEFLKVNNVVDFEQLILKSSAGKEDEVPTKEIDNMVFWSPIKMWYIEDDILVIGDEEYKGDEYLTLFPKFYYLTQEGATLRKIQEEFWNVAQDKLVLIIEKFLDDGVLTEYILDAQDLFSSQDKLLIHEYGEDLIIKKEAYEKFKEEQMNRSLSFDNNESIVLDNDIELPENLTNRYSCREYDKRIIPFKDFSKMCSVLKQDKKDGHSHYNYPSAGGLYPIDIYIFIKRDRVENIKGGLYYYNPLKQELFYVSDENSITSDAHYFNNKDIFNESAFSMFFIYNARVTMPRYRGSGYMYAFIDTGIIVATLTQICQQMDIGFCSIGDLNFDKIKSNFKLSNEQKLIHSIEGGLYKKEQ